MHVQHFCDPRTRTRSDVVHDEATRGAVVIDPELDDDPHSGRTWTESAEAIAANLRERELQLHFALDTHRHADPLTALSHFAERFGARTAIGAGIRQGQATWRDGFHLGGDFPVDGSRFDVLLEDGQRLAAGSLEIEAILTEEQTPSSLTFAIGDALFVGDLLFQPDARTARCDFPGDSAAVMDDAVQKVDARPVATRVFTLHDTQPGGRELAFQSTIGEQQRSNVHVEPGNVDGGRLPRPESNGVAYLEIPLNRF